MFVGDARYKTNFFLQFIDVSTKHLYERHIMSTTMYSVRCIILVLWIINVFFLEAKEEMKYLQSFTASFITLLSLIGSKSDLHFSLRFLSIIRLRQGLLVRIFHHKLNRLFLHFILESDYYRCALLLHRMFILRPYYFICQHS